MKRLERAAYLLHADTPRFRRKIADSKACIYAGVALCRRPVVSFSAGKDSAVMTWLVLDVVPNMPVRMLTRGESRALHPDLDDVVAQWQSLFPNMDFAEIDGDSYGQYGSKSGNIRRVIRESGDFDGQFVGLRSAESANRRASMLGWHKLPDQAHAIWRYAESDPHGRGGSYRICPIARWTLQDIGALIVAHEIPILGQYEREGLSARTSLGLNRTGRELGAVAKAKASGDREAYNRLIADRPDLERET